MRSSQASSRGKTRSSPPEAASASAGRRHRRQLRSGRGPDGGRGQHHGRTTQPHSPTATWHARRQCPRPQPGRRADPRAPGRGTRRRSRNRRSPTAPWALRTSRAPRAAPHPRRMLVREAWIAITDAAVSDNSRQPSIAATPYPPAGLVDHAWSGSEHFVAAPLLDRQCRRSGGTRSLRRGGGGTPPMDRALLLSSGRPTAGLPDRWSARRRRHCWPTDPQGRQRSSRGKCGSGQ
jgi:hypothetical protein